MSVKKSGTTTIDDIVNSNSTDRLQVFIMSWNMGNAPPTGLEYVFREKNATNDFDILVLGLQEATWPATDCIKILSDTVHGVVGEKYFLVSRYILQNSTLSISHRTPRFQYITGQACISRPDAAVCVRQEVHSVPRLEC